MLAVWMLHCKIPHLYTYFKANVLAIDILFSCSSMYPRKIVEILTPHWSSLNHLVVFWTALPQAEYHIKEKQFGSFLYSSILKSNYCCTRAETIDARILYSGHSHYVLFWSQRETCSSKRLCLSLKNSWQPTKFNITVCRENNNNLSSLNLLQWISEAFG